VDKATVAVDRSDLAKAKMDRHLEEVSPLDHEVLDDTVKGDALVPHGLLVQLPARAKPESEKETEKYRMLLRTEDCLLSDEEGRGSTDCGCVELGRKAGEERLGRRVHGERASLLLRLPSCPQPHRGQRLRA